MLEEILEESWVYQQIKAEAYAKGFAEGLAEGKAEGEVKVLRPTLVHLVKRLFPELTDQAEQISQSTHDPERLWQIVDALFDAETLEEARAALMQED